MASGGRLGWLLVAVACQFVWGIYPAALRFLQTKADRPLTSLQLSFLINVFALPSLFFGTTLPLLIINACRRRKREEGIKKSSGSKAAAAEPAGPKAHGSSGGGDELTEPLLSPADREDSLEEQQQQQQHSSDLEAHSAPEALPLYPSFHSGELPSAPPLAASPPAKGPPPLEPAEPSQLQPTLSKAAGKTEGETEAEASLADVPPPVPSPDVAEALLAVPSELSPPAEAAAPLAPAGAASAATVIASEPLQGHQRPLPPPTDGTRRSASWRQQAAVLMGTTCFLTGLFLCQVFSLLFTTAPLSQMVFLLSPLIVAFLAKALFKSPLPPGIWPALFFMLLGSSMVIASKASRPAHASDSLAQPWPGSLLGSAPGSEVPVPVGAAVARQPVSLWQDRAEEAWLCTAVFGAERGSWVCGLEERGDEDKAGTWEGEVGAAAAIGSATSTASTGSQQGEGGGQGQGASSSNVRKMGRHRKKPSTGLTWRDGIGMGMSFLGACSLAAFMLLVQRSRGMVSEQQVLYANFTTLMLMSLALTYHFEYWRWGTIEHLGLHELGQVAMVAAGVQWGCNYVQQLCIKALGAPQTAAFLPVRLLGSLAASYPLLNEGLEGPVQWGGAAILCLAVTGYLVKQKKAAEQAAAQHLLAAMPAPAPARGGQQGEEEEDPTVVVL